jgi:hypothetical protein
MTTVSVIVHEPVEMLWAPWTVQEIADRQLLAVEIDLDGEPMAGVPPIFPIPAEFYSYTLPPSLLTLGTHVIRGRVVSLSGNAGEWTELAIEITPLAPGLLRDVRVVAGTKLVNIDIAKAMAHAYNTLAGRKPLKDADLIALGGRYLELYPDGQLTSGRLLKLFDDEFSREAKS